MGKDKLRKFRENLTFRCMIQPEFDEIFNKDYKLKGRWASDFFGNSNPIVLELGCGKGEYAVDLARRYPEKNFMGVDIKGARMWRGAKTATQENLPNIAFIRTRIEFINSFFASDEVSEIWLTFSDPRLKSSEAHKRLTSPMFLERYSKFLEPSGIVQIKTDSAHLHHYTKFVIKENSLPTLQCIDDIYALGDAIPELLTIQTAYEKRFVAEGLPITYLAFSLDGKKTFQAGEFWGDAAQKNLDELRERKIRVDIDPRSGFCFGVVRAITAAEEFLQEDGNGYSLGEIVHNRVETSRLEEKGLKIIEHKDLETLPKGSKVLIRAHGEPPSTFKKIEELKFDIIDATCPVVAALQTRVRKTWDMMQKVGGQVAILGKQGHSEVVGLIGQVNQDAVVIQSMEDIEQLDFSRPITLLSQTTQSIKLFKEIAAEIIRCSEKPENVQIIDSICRQVSGRNSHLREFSKRYEVIIFVSGRHSSNGKALYEICKYSNAKSYFIETEDELLESMIEGAKSIGVCGATSTPHYLMKKIVKKIELLVSNQKK